LRGPKASSKRPLLAVNPHAYTRLQGILRRVYVKITFRGVSRMILSVILDERRIVT
jgi:hypothetical protein